MWSDRKQRLAKRKQKLGEKFTSDWTWRKFSTEQLAQLNPTVDFDTVGSIYEIGWCNEQDKYFNLLTNYINDNKLNKIQELNKTIDYREDGLGRFPVGEYLKTFVWTMKNGQSFVQVVKGSFDKQEEEIKFQQDITKVDIKILENRKLIYPVD
ncbi:MAG TPA: hypothetical protein VLC98_16100 [Phnomibacter sp.]|nr:hypothetical protein [Phnomibacter sp.]